MGPVTGFLNPDEILGQSVVPIVSLSVAIILFEGGMSLGLKELKGTGGALTSLLTVGAVITWSLSAYFAHLLIGFDWKMSVLFGAILIVTGPTVIGPLLRHVRPIGKAGTILKWEGLAIDPVGAVAAVLAFEFLFAEGGANSGNEAVMALISTFGFGTVFGLVGAGVIVLLLKRFWVPDYLINPISVALVLLVYVTSNHMADESGLVAVTVMGFALKNQRWVRVGHILEFKENLRVLLISILFVLLAARLSPEILGQIKWQHLVFVFLLIAVVRPVSVLASTFVAKISREERLFMCFLAPRGVVAAAIASIFAIQLDPALGESLISATFLVIIVTVVAYGFAAMPLAKRLGLTQKTAGRLLMLGSTEFSRRFALALKDAGAKPVIIDTNLQKVNFAVSDGLEALQMDFLENEDAEDAFSVINCALAMTANDNANELLAARAAERLGQANAYRLSKSAVGPREHSGHLHSGRVLFSHDATHQWIMNKLESGWEIRASTDDEPLSEGVELATVGSDGSVSLQLTGQKAPAKLGATRIRLVPPQATSATSSS